MSDTPRTDANEIHTDRFISPGEYTLVGAEFARQLERERNAWEEKFQNECRKHDETVARAMRAERDLAAKQAEIDRLMLEFCPDDMTREQFAEWAKNQKPVTEAAPDQVSELLAVLNRDGGHHQANVGRQQAAKDAIKEVDRMRQILAEHNLLDAIPSAVRADEDMVVVRRFEVSGWKALAERRLNSALVEELAKALKSLKTVREIVEAQHCSGEDARRSLPLVTDEQLQATYAEACAEEGHIAGLRAIVESVDIGLEQYRRSAMRNTDA